MERRTETRRCCRRPSRRSCSRSRGSCSSSLRHRSIYFPIRDIEIDIKSNYLIRFIVALDFFTIFMFFRFAPHILKKIAICKHPKCIFHFLLLISFQMTSSTEINQFESSLKLKHSFILKRCCAISQ